ncbi:MAG TPA: DUF6261 family protein [Bacteroidales bacterium]
MKITSIRLKELRNEEHAEFFNVFKGKLNNYAASWLVLIPLVTEFDVRYNKETQALELIRKSAKTQAINDADDKRDTTFRGMSYSNLAATCHFTPAIREAGLRLQVVLDHYGNLAAKSLDIESASIRNLLEELNTNYAADMALTGLDAWATQLELDNNAVVELMEDRNLEAAGKTTLRMKNVRVEVDEVYKAITGMINSMMFGSAPTEYDAFVNELNIHIDRYNLKIAQRKGHAASGNGESSSEGESQETGTGEINPVTLP